MLTVISPAKKLNETAPNPSDYIEMTEPAFGTDALRLARLAGKLSVQELMALMGISENLARLNHARFKAFSKTPAPGAVFSAVRCFAGDTYQGLDVRTLSDGGVAWASGHLRILSGLYGLLRPFDGIQSYRLEMGSRLKNTKGPDLYAYWGDRIAQALNAQGAAIGADTLVNCASVEYFSAAHRKALKLRVVTPVFLEDADGASRMVSFWAKRARGAMARFICENALTDADDLRGFDLGGYTFRPDLSHEGRPVFTRPEQRAQAA